MRETEPGQEGAGGGDAQRIDERPPQQPHRHRVEEQGSLTGESNHATVGIQLQQLRVV